MPIPPRPVPRQHRRPGHSVPQKASGGGTSAIVDWRAEVAFLDSYATSKAAARSAPLPTPGIAIMDVATRARQGSAAITAGASSAGGGVIGSSSGVGQGGSEGGRREADLIQLIEDGRGKREKRASTSTALGYDFIHNPSVLVLPDTIAETTSYPSPRAASSLLASTRPGRPSSPRSFFTPSRLTAPSPSPSAPLAKTPSTPGLIPADTPAAPHTIETGDGDSDLDEWEHVDWTDGNDTERGEDGMILGELELEVEVEEGLGGLALIDKKEALGMKRVDGLSYAAALGRRREQGQVV